MTRLMIVILVAGLSVIAASIVMLVVGLKRRRLAMWITGVCLLAAIIPIGLPILGVLAWFAPGATAPTSHNDTQGGRSTPLHRAAMFGAEAEVHKLIAEGADVNTVDGVGATPIGCAALNGHLEVMKILVDAGADVNKGGSDGQTAMHLASMKGDAEMVKLLLAKGAELGARNMSGETALWLAKREGHQAVVDLLASVGGAATRDDILDRASQRPSRQSRTGDDGRPVFPKYGHFLVDAAADALADISRPWTVDKMIRLYQQEKDPERAAHILLILAASRDPRAAIILGEDLTDEILVIRVMATLGIVHFFMDHIVAGGMESQMFAAQVWWKKNEQSIRREAGNMGEKNTEPEAEGDAVDRAP